MVLKLKIRQVAQDGTKIINGMKKSPVSESNLFPIFGTHPVLEYLRALGKFIKWKQEFPKILFKIQGKISKNIFGQVKLIKNKNIDNPQNRQFSQIIEIAEKEGIEVTNVHPSKLEKISFPHSHQGIALLTPDPLLWEIDEKIFSRFLNGEIKGHFLAENQKNFLILDGITDIQNFAAMLRSAVALGINWIVISQDSRVRITPAVFKISAGAACWARILFASNIKKFCSGLLSLDIPLLITVTDPGARVIFDLAQENSLVDKLRRDNFGLVIGNEQKGIRKGLKALSPLHFRLPMAGPVSSLNASHAATAFLALIKAHSLL